VSSRRPRQGRKLGTCHVVRSLSVDERQGRVRGDRDLARAKGVALPECIDPLLK
jgi:hypothetical protein